MGNLQLFTDFWLQGEAYRLGLNHDMSAFINEYEPIPFVDYQREIFRQIAMESNGMFILHSALSELEGPFLPTTWEPSEVTEHLLLRMQQTGYSLWHKIPVRFVSSDPHVQPNDDPSEEPAPKNLDFIEIYLVDSQGEPIPYESYLIKLPNGRECSGRLDKNGFVRINGIEPGKCEITFPQLEASSWQLAS